MPECEVGFFAEKDHKIFAWVISIHREYCWIGYTKKKKIYLHMLQIHVIQPLVDGTPWKPEEESRKTKIFCIKNKNLAEEKESSETLLAAREMYYNAGNWG